MAIQSGLHDHLDCKVDITCPTQKEEGYLKRKVHTTRSPRKWGKEVPPLERKVAHHVATILLYASNTMYFSHVSSFYFICVFTLLCVPSYYYMWFLTLLYMFLRTTEYVSSYYDIT